MVRFNNWGGGRERGDPTFYLLLEAKMMKKRNTNCYYYFLHKFFHEFFKLFVYFALDKILNTFWIQWYLLGSDIQRVQTIER